MNSMKFPYSFPCIELVSLKLNFLLTGILVLLSIQLAGQTAEWAINLSSTADSTDQVSARGLFADSENNLIVYGRGKGHIDFNPIDMDSAVIEIPNESFIAKYTPNGEHLFTIKLPINFMKVNIGINDEIVVYGRINDSLNLSVPEEPHWIYGPEKLFIARYDIFGNFMDVIQFGIGLVEQATYTNGSITTDKQGDYLISGRFIGAIDILGLELYPSSGWSPTSFYAKISPNGLLIFGGYIDNVGSAGTVDIGGYQNTITELKPLNSGGFVMTGFADRFINFTPGDSTGFFGMLRHEFGFVAKYSNNGDFLQAHFFPTSVSPPVSQPMSWSMLYDFTLDSLDNIYVRGYHIGLIEIPTMNDTVVIFDYYQGNHIVKLNKDLEVQWAFGLNNVIHPHSDVLNETNSIFFKNGMLYITGSHSGQTDFDPGTDQFFLPAYNASGNIFLAKYNTDAVLQCAMDIPVINSQYRNQGRNVLINENNDLFLAANYKGNSNLNGAPCELGSGLSSETNATIIAKFNQAQLCMENDQIVEETYATICDGEIYNFLGEDYTSANVYIHFFPDSITGCDTLRLLNLSVTKINTNIILDNGDTHLSVLQNFADYQWVDCNNGFAPIPGATNKKFAPSSSGSYAVIVSYKDCEETSDCIEFTYVNTEEHVFSDHWKLFPNPATSTLHLSANNSPMLISTIEIYSLTGKQVKELSGIDFLPETTLTIDVSDINSGMYFIRISNLEASVTFSFVKQ